jgi:hypothetical protein
MRATCACAIRMSILAIGVLLSGCGGDDGTVVSTPASPNYPTLASLSGSWSARGARFDYIRINNAPIPTYSVESPNIEISYDSASQTYSIRGVTVSGATRPTESTYGPSQRVSGNPNSYDAATMSNGATNVSRLMLGQGGGDLTYSNVGEWVIGSTSATGDQDFHTFTFTYGIRTRSDDMPTSGTAAYGLQLGGQGPGAPVVGNGSLSANFAAGTVSVSISPEYFYRPGQGPNVFATLTGTGTISSSTSSFDSSVAGNGDSGKTYNGEVHGLFYGPQAVEVGGGFLVKDTGGNVVAAGTISGRRN